jgi:hypothetical protein
MPDPSPITQATAVVVLVYWTCFWLIVLIGLIRIGTHRVQRVRAERLYAAEHPDETEATS